MKIKIKTIIITLVVIFAISIFYMYYSENKIYVLKEYNNSGKLLGTNEYILKNGDTIFNGKFVNYNENGVKISEGQFIDNELFGKCVYYFDNGKVESVQFKKDSKTVLEDFWYDKDGKIEQYTLYDLEGKPILIINYDKDGVVSKFKGIPLKQINEDKFNLEQHFKVGEVLKYQYLIANIPNTKRSFKIENVGVNQTTIKRVVKHIEPAEFNVEEVLKKKGLNTFKLIVKYDFNDKITPVLSDTITFNIKVD